MKGNSWYLKAFYNSTVYSVVIAILINTNCMAYFQSENDIPVNLNIPDKSWDSSRPDKSVGWCAEACIQMALEYYGEKKTQKEINKAGNPEQPDLYMDDIDVALKKLSVKYHSWPLSNNNIEEFVDWIKLMLNQMYPVVCGVKIYPDEHPDWFLDHFVLIVGYNKNGFIVNTNIYGQKLISYKNLMFKKNGFSFCNEYRKYFARAITGVK